MNSIFKKKVRWETRKYQIYHNNQTINADPQIKLHCRSLQRGNRIALPCHLRLIAAVLIRRPEMLFLLLLSCLSLPSHYLYRRCQNCSPTLSGIDRVSEIRPVVTIHRSIRSSHSQVGLVPPAAAAVVVAVDRNHRRYRPWQYFDTDHCCTAG